MNMDDLERKVAEMADTAALPTWTPDQRESTRAAYQVRADALAAEMKPMIEALEQSRQSGQLPGRGTVQALSRLMRQHQGAQASLRRLTAAIAKLDPAPPATGQRKSGRRARRSPPLLLATHEARKQASEEM